MKNKNTEKEVNEVIDKLSEMTSIMVNGVQNMYEVDDVEVATAEKHVVWQDGKIKLYHFANDNTKAKTPLMITYALVNRPDMLDLQPDRSLIRKLLSEGLDVYLIDWGYPTRNDRFRTINDHVNGYMSDAIDFIAEKHQVPAINLLGVCQGGTFSLMYAALHPEKVKNLITMVTPADFATDDGLLFRWSRNMDVDAVVDNSNGLVSGNFLNTGYDLLKPMKEARKYMGMADIMANKSRYENFLRMEKWVKDSPDQPGETFRQFIKDLYQGNKLVKGEFQLNGDTVNLKNVTMPLMNIYAASDHIVPPNSTKPINDLVGSSDKQLYEFPGGHIGVFVGGRSQKDLAPSIAKFILDRDN